MDIASIQEGKEWISRLESDAAELLTDLNNYGHLLTNAGASSLQYAYIQTENAINSLKMEIMLFDDEGS